MVYVSINEVITILYTVVHKILCDLCFYEWGHHDFEYAYVTPDMVHVPMNLSSRFCILQYTKSYM